MIYISSSCVKYKTISESVEFLARNDIKHIELSGGTNYYPTFENDLLELKDKYGLTYQIHNYFPPPEQHFVLNLASLNDQIFNTAMSHCKRAIALAQNLGSNKYGLHAGFFIDPVVDDLGKKIRKSTISNKEEAIKRFCNGFKILQENSGPIDLYIENNVISATNFETYGENIFMLTNSREYFAIKKEIDFNLLLDIAHLKVSCKTLGLNFEKEFEILWEQSNYIHLSDNDGLHDSNQSISKKSSFYDLLKNQNFSGKTFSLEIYNNFDEVKKTYQLLNELL